MPKPDWGKKVICDKCLNKFYDMKKTSPVCPKCDHTVKPVSLTKAKRASVAVAKSPAKDEDIKGNESDLVIEDIVDDDDDDDDDSLIVTDDDLDDTDEDLSVVKEHMGPGEDD